MYKPDFNYVSKFLKKLLAYSPRFPLVIRPHLPPVSFVYYLSRLNMCSKYTVGRSHSKPTRNLVIGDFYEDGISERENENKATTTVGARCLQALAVGNRG